MPTRFDSTDSAAAPSRTSRSGGVSHHCIGASLARHEGRLALQWMVERFETVERIGDVAVNEPFILRGLTTLADSVDAFAR